MTEKQNNRWHNDDVRISSELWLQLVDLAWASGNAARIRLLAANPGNLSLSFLARLITQMSDYVIEIDANDQEAVSCLNKIGNRLNGWAIDSKDRKNWQLIFNAFRDTNGNSPPCTECTSFKTEVTCTACGVARLCGKCMKKYTNRCDMECSSCEGAGPTCHYCHMNRNYSRPECDKCGRSMCNGQKDNYGFYKHIPYCSSIFICYTCGRN